MPIKPSRKAPPARNKLARVPTNQQDDGLEEDRLFLLHIGKVLSGFRAIHEDPNSVLVYRLNTMRNMGAIPQGNMCEFGTISYQGGEVLCYTEDHEYRIVRSVTDAAEALELLTAFYHAVHDRRRNLAVSANKKMKASGTRYSTPGGPKGNLVKEFDVLLEQLQHEHFRQKARHINSQKFS